MSGEGRRPGRDRAVVVLAAGLGKRFKSHLAKVLHPVAGRPMIGHVLAAAAGIEGVVKTVVVLGNDAGRVRQAALREAPGAVFVTQEPQLGTGHAVMCCEEALAGFDGTVVVLPGDHPLLTPATLGSLLSSHESAGAQASVLTARLDDPAGYGRIVRGSGGSFRIVEDADAAPEEQAVKEVSLGIWCFERRALFDALAGITADNAQGEYYLPDVVPAIHAAGGRLNAVMAEDTGEVMGVNDRAQQAAAASEMRRRAVERLTAAGVTVDDPAATYVDAGVEVGADTRLMPGTILEGGCVIGSGCVIGPYSHLVDTEVADGASVSYSVARSAYVGPGASVGPFASLRPGTRLEAGARAGTFVEMKNTTLGEGSKVPHLSYMGDAAIGAGVNVGAGSITCNYDGETGVKSRTVIEDGALIGSDTMLVAPLNVGRDAVTGAGAVVTRDIAEGEVVVGSPGKAVRKRKPRSEAGGGS